MRLHARVFFGDFSVFVFRDCFAWSLKTSFAINRVVVFIKVAAKIWWTSHRLHALTWFHNSIYKVQESKVISETELPAIKAPLRLTYKSHLSHESVESQQRKHSIEFSKTIFVSGVFIFERLLFKWATLAGA